MIIKKHVYIARITGNGEEFYKMGVTECPDLRVQSLRTADYAVNLLILQPFVRHDLAFKCENTAKKLLGDSGYTPRLRFTGRTECFNKDALNVVMNTIVDHASASGDDSSDAAYVPQFSRLI